MNDKKQMTVGEAVGATMKAYGAEYVFTLTGAPQDPLIHMNNHLGIKVILGRSERSVFAMGDAYARLTGKPTFGVTQYGPGATYMPASIVDAFWAHSPLVTISGSTQTGTRHRFEYQEIDQAPLFPPITRWAGDLPRPDRIADLMRTAIRTAVSGTPGPTYLGIPADWFTQPAGTPDIYAEQMCLKAPAFRTAPLPEDVDKAVKLLAKARQPVIFAGGGVMLSEGWDALTALAETLNAPVVTTMSGKGAIAETHRLAVGTGGRYSRKIANEVLGKADVVLAIGTRLGSMETDVFKFPRQDATIIHVDVDSSGLGRTYNEAVSMLADARTATEHIADAVGQAGLGGEKAAWSDWTRSVGKQVAEWRATYRKLAEEKIRDGKLNPIAAIGIINEWLGDDDVVVADTGYMAAWTATMIEQRIPGRNILRAAGSLGWAFPAAFGAKLAARNRRVVGINGDGGLGYHISDIETARRIGTPAIQIVMNNSTLGFEYHVQKHLHKELCPEASDFLDTDYAAVARAFGAHGERVETAEELLPALRRAEESGEPALIDLIVSPEVPPPVSRYEPIGMRYL